MIERLERDWSDRLTGLLQGAQESVIVCAPFVSSFGVQLVHDALSNSTMNWSSSHVITNLSLSATVQGATDPGAVYSLARSLAGCHVSHVPGLHAKVYVADTERAIVTSGNLTAGGLMRNFEYGLEIDDDCLVKEIRNDVLAFADLGAAMTEPTLAKLADLAENVRETNRRKLESVSTEDCRAFENALSEAEDHLIRQRLGGGSLHATFARTIEYLLRRYGPLPTVVIHERIREIHPDLCDDSVDRVIDGIHFGKKWKHAVRTAQQMLKREDKVTLAGGTWSLIEHEE